MAIHTVVGVRPGLEASVHASAWPLPTRIRAGDIGVEIASNLRSHDEFRLQRFVVVRPTEAVAWLGWPLQIIRSHR